MNLPLLISVPHAGFKVPAEVKQFCRLPFRDIEEDGDEGAHEIYYPLRRHVAQFLNTDVARAFIDMNRNPNDISSDGVVKTHTCYGKQIYAGPLPMTVVDALLSAYYFPYHRNLGELGARAGVKLGIDCHTMATFSPPIAAHPGQRRPAICLSDGDGVTCPADWTGILADHLSDACGVSVSVNRPFTGGFITRSRPGGIPWLQLEMSRDSWRSNPEKTRCLTAALVAFCDLLWGKLVA